MTSESDTNTDILAKSNRQNCIFRIKQLVDCTCFFKICLANFNNINDPFYLFMLICNTINSPYKR